MSKEKYTVSSEYIKSADFNVLVIGQPVEDIEDLLTALANERGKISKSKYEDFLMANCIANLNQLMAHITALLSDATISLDLLKVRDEIRDIIIKYNPDLDPSNIVVNKNKVLKIKTSDSDTDSLPLEDNSFWNQPLYDSKGNYTPAPVDTSIYSSRMSKDKTKSMAGLEEESPEVPITDINDLPYTKVKSWWDRLGEYISVKKFSLDDADKVLKYMYFHNSTSFNTFIVSSCIIDIEEIYERVENMGANVDSRKIIQELFSICSGVNEGLTFSRFKDLHDKETPNTQYDVEGEYTGMPYTGKAAVGLKKVEKKTSFKDIPKKDLLALPHNMKAFLIGQDEAVDVVTKSIKRASVGLKDPLKPIGSFLFAGRTGCGKSYSTKILADELIRAPKNRIIIDCSEYSSDHEYAKLIGAPAGYIGYDSGGILTNRIKENPFSVVVFDEIEKASTKVYDLLLQILDEGRLTDSKGQVVSFKDTIIIMTSNIGVKEIDAIGSTIGFGNVAVLTEDKKSKALDTALKNRFKPEFLNRIDAIVHFKDLTDDNYMKIIGLELNKLSDNLKTNDTEFKSIKLTFDKKVKSLIFSKGVDDKFGARPIKRAIEKYVSNKVADILLTDDISPTAEIKVSATTDEVKVRVINDAFGGLIVETKGA